LSSFTPHTKIGRDATQVSAVYLRFSIILAERVVLLLSHCDTEQLVIEPISQWIQATVDADSEKFPNAVTILE